MLAFKERLTRIARRGTPLEWGFLLGLAAPMTTYHLVLRTIRVLDRSGMTEVLRWVDVYKSDIFFHAAFMALGLAALIMLRGRKSRFAVLALLQVVALIVTQVETVAFRFFMATGSTIDFQLIWFSLSQMSETFDVVASEVPTYIWWMMGVSAVLVLALPWLMTLGWKKLQTRLHADEPHPERQPRRVWPMVAAAVVTFLLALTPPFAERSYAFARNATLNVAMSTAWSLADIYGTKDKATTTNTANATLKPRDADMERRNVVVILLESTRARSVGLYDPELETTPHLVELGKSSLVAERAYTVVPHTSKALVATLCGIEPRLHMPITEAMPNGIPGKCLARLLGEQGYRTAFFQSATQRFENRKQMVDNMGYGTFVPLEKMSKKGFKKVNYFGVEDDVMLEPSGEWIDEVKNDPFFLTYLTLTPHHNYLAPRKYGRHDFHEDDEVNRYMNTVHYVDAFVNNVIEMFKEKGLYEETIFVILGDHGEGFGEHGRRQHDNVIWEEGVHVPLIIHDPSRFTEGKRLPYNVNQLDIIPTVADMLGYEIQNASFPGDSMLDLARHRTMRAHCWYERRCMASIYKDEKYIYHFDQRPDEFFDLSEDPLEKNDLAAETPDLQRRRSDLVMWRERVNSLYKAHSESRLKKFVTSDPPVVTHPIDGSVEFGGFARLVGVQAPTEPVRPGTNVAVTFVFEVLEPPPDGYKLFLHGQAEGVKMKNLDHIPVDGLYPLEDWKRGEFVADTVRVRIPLKAKKHYELWTGFYSKQGRAKVTGDVEIDADRALGIRLPIEPRK